MQDAATNRNSFSCLPVCQRDPKASTTTSKSCYHPGTTTLTPVTPPDDPILLGGETSSVSSPSTGSDNELVQFVSRTEGPSPSGELASRRASSTPAVRPLRSALAHPIHQVYPTEIKDKRAHFYEYVLSSDLPFRTESALEREDTASITDLSERDFSLSSYSMSSDQEDPEIENALGIFGEVVDELIQVAEEHEEARVQLAEVASGVADALAKDEEEASESVLNCECHDEDRESFHSITSESGSSRSSYSPKQTMVDQDLDETCFDTMGLANDDAKLSTDDEGLDSRSERSLYDMGASALAIESAGKSTRAESNGSAETVIRPRRSISPISHHRRASESDASNIIIAIPVPRIASDCIFPPNRVRAEDMERSRDTYDRGVPQGQVTETIHDPSQIFFQEPPTGSPGNPIGLVLFDAAERDDVVPLGSNSRALATDIPMERLKTRLAAWSRARESSVSDEYGGVRWIPLLSLPESSAFSRETGPAPLSEGPLSPQNSERPSGASSAKHSAPRSPPSEPDLQNDQDENEEGRKNSEGEEGHEDEDDEDRPIELRALSGSVLRTVRDVRGPGADYVTLPVGQSRSLPSTPGGNALMIPIHRQLSNLPEEHFVMHRDSMLLMRDRELEGAMAVNQHLMHARDSMILTRSKFNARSPRSKMKEGGAGERSVVLRSALDASISSSPASNPETMDRSTAHSHERSCSDAEKRKEAEAREHVGCPICEVERPRWFAVHCRKSHFM